jgi:D-alanine-D-alanine ligase
MISKKDRIAVVCGGCSSENETSIATGENVYKALIEDGYNAILVKLDSEDIVHIIKEEKPDIIFNALHGKFGEDGKINKIIESLQIPITHCSALSASIAINKIKTKEFCSNIDGLHNIPFKNLQKNQKKINQQILTDFPKPFVIKPIEEGSSRGVVIIEEGKSFGISDLDWSYGNELLVEKYIEGQEIAVAIFQDNAIGAIEIKPSSKFYDYQAKYLSQSEYVMPANISEDIYNKVLDFSLKCHKKIRCDFFSRVDILVERKTGKIFLLEINTHPGMTENSLFPKIAAYHNISFLEIIVELLNYAKKKKEKPLS